MKRHKIPASRLVAIPQALTPMRPLPGEFMRFTTPLPPADWNIPTLRLVARHCLCPIMAGEVIAELKSRGETDIPMPDTYIAERRAANARGVA